MQINILMSLTGEPHCQQNEPAWSPKHVLLKRNNSLFKEEYEGDN